MNEGTGTLRRTPLADRHARLGAKMGPFADYDMPIMYGGIAAEHRAVRTASGIFDVSHMGRLRFHGDAGAEAIERLATIHVPALAEGRARYGFVLTEDGGIIDDVILYRLGAASWLLVVNASNRAAVLEQLGYLGYTPGALADDTDATGMIALQGPKARDVLARVMSDVNPPAPSMRAMTAAWEGHPLILATTGYTGEDGAELILPADAAGELWDRLLAAGATPAGLGARDTLRLEAGYPLHGHEISRETTPWQAGMPWGVDLRNTAFHGRDRLLARKDEPAPRLAGLRALARGVPRAGQEIAAGGTTVGRTTSGTFSPTLETGIAVGYLDPAYAEPGTAVEILAGSDRRLAAEVAALPFYRGSRRSSRE